MIQADSVHRTPPTNTPILSPGLVQQQRKRERALRRIAKLRQKASNEIERLLAFLDESDAYASTELELSEVDLEYGGDDEPSLGSSDRTFDQDGTWASHQ
jgi:hypothetical protein